MNSEFNTAPTRETLPAAANNSQEQRQGLAAESIAPAINSASPERAGMTDSASQGPQPQAVPGVQLPAVQAQPSSSLQSPQQPSPSNGTSPAIADDVDVIEKEWVDKAKDIVTATKDDPYRQEEEVEKLKADYLKKRYGKDIKSSTGT